MAKYDVNEVFTGNRWIDNRKIYRKMVEVVAGPDNEELSLAHGIDDLSFVVELKGMLKAPTMDQGSFRLLPFVGDPASATDLFQTSIQLRVLDDNVLIKSFGDYSASAGWVIIEFVKAA